MTRCWTPINVKKRGQGRMALPSAIFSRYLLRRMNINTADKYVARLPGFVGRERLRNDTLARKFSASRPAELM